MIDKLVIEGGVSPSMSGGGPNSANRCDGTGALGAAISALPLMFLDTNATVHSTKTNHLREPSFR
jgi:hypothetical protein